ncbi:MAG TPA: hypothetical protein VFY58_02285 [Nocardioides sp.]|nr:hypothetical protein [Nocardioides sp.]
MRARLLVLGAALVVLALVVAGLLWWRSAQLTDLQRAIAVTPPDAQRLSWTDWAAVREELGAGIAAGSETPRLESFLDEGFETDLTSSSALVQSATALHERYGLSPASLEWELLSQSEEGAVVLLGAPDSLDFDALADRLERLGYDPPESDTGVWEGGPDVLAGISPDLTPELQHIALDADRQLVVASDRSDYLDRAMETVVGEEDSLTGFDEVVEAAGEPLSAAIYSGEQTCQALAMSSADRADQAQAEELIQNAGEVNPVTGFAMAVQPNRDVRVVLGFESEDQARVNADSRAVLARGPAPGQGGDFSDRFTVDRVTAEGSLVTLALDPAEGEYVLSDLSSGPVLFATC